MKYYLLIGMMIAVYWMVAHRDHVADALEQAKADCRITPSMEFILLMTMFTTITVLWPVRLLGDKR